MKAWIFALSIALGGGLLSSVSSIAAPALLADEQPVETYVVTPPLAGKPISILVQFFDARLLDQPEVIAQLRQLPFEEILSVTEAKEQTREPGQVDDFHRREQSLEGGAAPLVRVEAQKGMFGKLRRFLRGSFSRSSPADNKTSVQFGVVSASISGTVRTFLLLTDGKGIQEIAAVVVTNVLSTFTQNRWAKQFGHLFSRSWNTSDPKVNASVITGIARRAIWFQIFLEIYEFVDKGHQALALEPQIHMVMLTLMFGVPDAWTSYLLYEKYKKPDPAHPGELIPDEAKIGLVNFWIGSVTGIASGMDQIQHHLNAVLIPMHHYDFRISGLVLIGYYSFLIYKLYKKPEGIHRGFAWFQDFVLKTLSLPGRPVLRWFNQLVADCDWIYDPERFPAPEVPKNTPPLLPQEALPQ
jgi:hypothetical protein